jgi:hypothetical protein
MIATQLQHLVRKRLQRFFGDTVVIEWPISKGASDALAPNSNLYSPRVDDAVYTAGMNPGNHLNDIREFWDRQASLSLKNAVAGYSQNSNPRCALAIEVVFSGSAKHVHGDIANASIMGMYGIVVPNPKMEARVRRNFEYVQAAAL